MLALIKTKHHNITIPLALKMYKTLIAGAALAGLVEAGIDLDQRQRLFDFGRSNQFAQDVRLWKSIYYYQ